jgi:alpha-tubulin suppressor-like RCC1 family protein
MGSPLGPRGPKPVVARPTEVAGGFVSIGLGGNHGCGLEADGNAFCWGANGAGELGIGTISNSVGLPQPVATSLKFTAISAGAGFTCGLEKGTGFAWCWGDNEVNQLGQTSPSNQPGQSSTIAQSPTPMRVLPPASGTPVAFVSISSGADHVCAIDTSAAIWCWGSNTAGRAGIEMSLCGGPMGVGPCSFWVPQMITASKPPFNLTFSQVSAGTESTCGITTTGALHCWGHILRGSQAPVASFDAPALVTQVAGAVSVSVGASASCAVAASGQLFCWGDNSSGRLGTGLSGGNSVTPVPVAGSQGYASVSVASQSACARTTGGGVRCWGSNSNGQLGLGLPAATQMVATPTDVLGLQSSLLVSGAQHVCSLDPQGVAACWGSDLFGQIGQGGGHILPTVAVVPVPVARFFLDTLSAVPPGKVRPAPDSLTNSLPVPSSHLVHASIGQMTFSEIAVGGQHVCAIGNDGAAYCWGADGLGQVGNGPRIVAFCRSGAAACVSNPTLVSSNPNYRFTHIGAAAAHNCGLTRSGQILCWGTGSAGELGKNLSCSSGPCFSRVPLAPQFASPPPGTFLDVAGADGSSCAINAGAVFCWGQLAGGPTPVREQLSPPSLMPKAVGVGPGFACIRSKWPVLFRPDVLQCFGNNQFGELGNGKNVPATTPQDVARDDINPFHLNLHFACGIQFASVFCWGQNLSGQLGNGTTTNSNVPVAVSLSSFSAANVGTGFSHACAVDTAGAMFCWGDDKEGELGNGMTVAQPVSTPVPVAAGWTLP